MQTPKNGAKNGNRIPKTIKPTPKTVSTEDNGITTKLAKTVTGVIILK